MDFDPLSEDEPAKQIEPEWLETLNPEQQDALQYLEGPALVLAGAGTGKTRVLCARLAQLIRQNYARPWEILCVTFTNKAAREMRERVEQLIGANVDHGWLGTFHSVSARILRQHHQLLGLQRDFIILNSDDQVRLLKRIIREQNLDESQNSAKLLAYHISRWKDKALLPEQITPEIAGPLAGGYAVQLYTLYQQALLQANAVDFGDLILHVLTILKNNNDVLSKWQNRFKFILVDEYQDTNAAQYLWLRLLAQSHHNICCVGDDDQSIYGWRGAEIMNILRFEKDFPDARIIKLERNYRSTPDILNAASNLIAHNDSRLGKTLWTGNVSGKRPIVRGVWDGTSEARFVTSEIETLIRKGLQPNRIAILVRMGFQTREFEEHFINHSIPYIIAGGTRFYEREEIRDILAYLRVAFQCNDDLAFERIVNKPRRNIGAASLQIVFTTARTHQCSLFKAAEIAVNGLELKTGAKKSIAGFIRMIAQWKAQSAHINHLQLVQLIMDESGYYQMLETLPPLENEARKENLKELIVAMENYNNLESFLEHVSLVMDNDNANSQNKIQIMTLHAAKGLEFDTVFLPGWEEGIFPSQRALSEKGVVALEEERRLAYVGLTRAEKHAIISFAGSRRIYGKWMSSMPSRFITDFPKDSIELICENSITKWGLNTKQDKPTSLAGATNVQGYHKTVDGYQNTKPLKAKETTSQQAKIDFKIGDSCFHQKFGQGEVLVNNAGQLLIRFKHAGEKHIMADFVKPA